MKRILIEGWRGINTSVAMVNQYQLIELLKLDGLELVHRDMPFFYPSWNAVDNAPGFSAEDQARIAAIPPPVEGSYDVIYSVFAPFHRTSMKASKNITYMITEFGLRPQNFAPGDCEIDFYTRDNNCIVVPSNWVKMKMEEFGFPANKVHLVPHGVDSQTYTPLSPGHRFATRKGLGLNDEHFAFLNLGAMTWNKGVDVLLRAFAWIRQHHSNARLLLKDSRQLYGVGAQDVVNGLMREAPGLLNEDVMASIVLVSSTLDQNQMNCLYGAADVYVSPYRAEGFNLPVIEAIAAGTPVIVTSGGPTDDFCYPSVAIPVKSTLVENKLYSIRDAGFFLEPKLDSLIEAMELSITGKGIPADVFQQGRNQVIEDFSWRACTEKLVALF